MEGGKLGEVAGEAPAAVPGAGVPLAAGLETAPEAEDPPEGNVISGGTNWGSNLFDASAGLSCNTDEIRR
jgi:hypothetical protein